jgi:hypothetical protein
MWQGAVFNHVTFPLTGAHSTAACTSCHQGGVYRGTPRQCAGCHLAEYNATTNPNHTASGFSTSCDQCHNTTMWQGAVFNHRFPLQGPHNVSCTTCHTNPSSYAAFDCLVCHEHNQTKMDDVHKEVSGYSYSSPACYGCHPTGR